MLQWLVSAQKANRAKGSASLRLECKNAASTLALARRYALLAGFCLQTGQNPPIWKHSGGAGGVVVGWVGVCEASEEGGEGGTAGKWKCDYAAGAKMEAITGPWQGGLAAGGGGGARCEGTSRSSGSQHTQEGLCVCAGLLWW